MKRAAASRQPLATALLLMTALLAVSCVPSVLADEGMWTYDNVPAELVASRHGFTPSREWLERVRLSSAGLGGCSASFISAGGLVMTNHHCVEGCLQDLSSAEQDLFEQGFFATRPGDERTCPGFEINQLVEIRDVSAEVTGATRGLDGQAFIDAQRAVTARLERSCGIDPGTRCEVVSLYGGGQYHLYRSRRWHDVRLVFAPEFSVAFFGGDPDNFNFPRFDLDVAFLRIYKDGKPAEPSHWFEWEAQGAREGELVFVSGKPGRTSRLGTIADLVHERDVTMPSRLIYLAEMRGLLTGFADRGPNEKRISMDRLFGVENSLKGLRGREDALHDPDVFARKVREEELLLEKVGADPALREKYLGAWSAIAAARRESREFEAAYRMIEDGQGFQSRLFDYARTVVRAAEEIPKPDETRLPDFTDARLPRLKERLLAPAAVHKDLERTLLTFSLTKMREELGADDPFIRRLFGPRSPREIALAAVDGTRLHDPQVRRSLLEGGLRAIEASTDPMIALARAVDPEARALRQRFEDRIESALKKNRELVAQARFAIDGKNLYPDATGTPRLSFGRVEGWQERGRKVAPFTTFAGMYERHTGRDPFNLPKRWLQARDSLNMATPLNFATTNDIIGGNSGSPVLNRDGRIVGLIFDGNIHSLGGDYWFDDALNRAVAVTSTAILEALEKVYGAGRIVEEIKGRKR